MWDERYSQDSYVFGTAPAAFLQAHANLLKAGASALVIADGEGRNSVYMAEQGVNVTAMDASPVGITKARTLAAERGVEIEFHEADLLTWPWEQQHYDLVVGIFFQFLSPVDRTAVFAGMKQALLPGGRVLVHGYTPKQLDYGTGGPPILENLYTEDLLRESFGDLEIEELVSYEAELSEGTGHVGQSAIVDLVARKP